MIMTATLHRVRLELIKILLLDNYLKLYLSYAIIILVKGTIAEWLLVRLQSRVSRIIQPDGD